MLNPLSLDIETAPVKGFPQEYALQPWRFKEGKAKIDCISVAKASGEAILVTNRNQFRALLKAFAGKELYTWKGTFDVAWLIAYGFEKECRDIKWRDAMILWKWLDNSQLCERVPKWSLADGVKRFFKDQPWCEPFIKMKKAEVHAGENDAYWETRAKLDAIMTSRIATVVLKKLDQQRIDSAMITMNGIVPVAASWVRGVTVDYSLINGIAPAVTTEMAEIEKRLGCLNHGDQVWTPSKVLRSSKQLGELIYGTWGLPIKKRSEKTGAPSTDKAALTYLADDDDEVLEILRWRKLNTQLTKYLQSPLKARAYLESDIVHPSASMFSTYTGRYTYTSKTKKKYATGIALHQWPRQKEFRALIKPRKGYKHVELDAAGQESRLMAEKSRDFNMMQVFKDGKDFHSYTGAQISGLSYEAFMKGKAEGNSAITGDHGFRYQGKFTNLSNNYRIGVKKLRVQARVQYGMNVEFMKAKSWQDAFHSSFPDVKPYWKSAIQEAKTRGYAVTMAGRRFRLVYWDKENRWSTESSAINFPIQGAGADMKDLAIQEIDKHFPEFEFWFDLHDGLHYECPIDMPDSRIIECREMLNNLDYLKWWGVAPVVPLTWDASVGKDWANLKELGTTYWRLDESESIGVVKNDDVLGKMMDNTNFGQLIVQVTLDEFLTLHREGWTA